MAKYYLRWQMNPQITITNPEERAKLLFSLLEMTKQDLQAGKLKDWGCFPGETCGYAIREAASEVDIATDTMKFVPYVIFEVKPVLTVDQIIEAFKKGLAEAQAKK
jgi:hypothetical protein